MHVVRLIWCIYITTVASDDNCYQGRMLGTVAAMVLLCAQQPHKNTVTLRVLRL
jgi:hypothetical protein